MKPSYITTFDIKQPNAETTMEPSKGAPIKTETSAKIAKEFFRDGPVFSHTPSGLKTVVESGK